jgi:hypothetical protein
LKRETFLGKYTKFCGNVNRNSPKASLFSADDSGPQPNASRQNLKLHNTEDDPVFVWWFANVLIKPSIRTRFSYGWHQVEGFSDESGEAPE